MSRSALWHQERNVLRRNKEAQDVWEAAIEEGRNNRQRNLIPLSGPDDSFRIEPMLLESIKKSQYFLKLCNEISTWNALVDEIYYKADSIEPWSVGVVKTPSEAFCQLLRLLTLRSTTNQMELMLNHQDSPYIRAIGFLYLRYTCEPAHIFDWFKPYLFDEEPIAISASKKAGGRSKEETIGGLVRTLLSASRDFYGTVLPRLPVQVERDIQVQLLQAEKVEKRAKAHFGNPKTMEHFQKLGSKVLAIYEDADNPRTWYPAEVDRVLLRSDDGVPLKHPKFVVTFAEYGNTETVLLGEMDLPNGKFFNEDQKLGQGGGGGIHPQGGVGQHDGRQSALYEEVRRRERETVTVSGRGGYFATRPPSTKTAMMSGGATGTRGGWNDRRRSPSPEYGRRPPPGHGDRASNTHNHNRGNDSNHRPSADSPPPRKRTAEEVAAIQDKKRKLMAKYG